MTISATNQGLRPGVCLSTSRPTTPFAGMLIFETDTNRLAVWNGTAWIVLADADTPPGLELIKTQSATSGSSVTISDAFSADFDNYQIVVSNCRTSSAVNLLMRVGAAATAYYWSGLYLSYASSPTLLSEGGTNATSYGTGIVSDSTAGTSASGTIFVGTPFLSKTTTLMTSGSDPRTNGANRWYSGYLNNTTSYTSFDIFTGGATFTTIDIRVYGYRNS